MKKENELEKKVEHSLVLFDEATCEYLIHPTGDQWSSSIEDAFLFNDSKFADITAEFYTAFYSFGEKGFVSFSVVPVKITTTLKEIREEIRVVEPI